MTQRIPLSSISPDLRFGLAGLVSHPGRVAILGGLEAVVAGCVPDWLVVPVYLRYADRDAALVVSGVGCEIDVERELAGGIGMVGESGTLNDLGLAVVVLDAVDSCFRAAELWGGNVYLASGRALTAALDVAGAELGVRRDPVAVMRELAALELAYLFPVAGKFRSGRYDGDVQYRLNGWGRALARRLDVGRTAALADEFRRRIGQHLAAEHDRYASFLRQVDAVGEGGPDDLLADALKLPIPVLV